MGWYRPCNSYRYTGELSVLGKASAPLALYGIFVMQSENSLISHLQQVAIQSSKGLLVCVIAAISIGCTQQHAIQTPANPSQKFYGNSDENGEHVTHIDTSKYVFASNKSCERVGDEHKATHYRADQALLQGHVVGSAQAPVSIYNKDLPLSPGDMLDVQIENGEGFNGKYVVDPDGSIQLPLIPPIRIAGAGVAVTAEKIEIALVRAGIFKPEFTRVSVRVLHWAEINVTVTGAVFEPGRVRINENHQESIVAERVAAVGDFATRRSIVEAIRTASGIRPDAKLDQVILVRNGWQIELNLSGIVSGNPVQDVALVNGDHIVVPTTGCFQSALVRPSQITPKGFRVFMSNLTVPSTDNAGSAVGRYSSSLPYGTTLLQAVVSANCVGGTQLTNAPRKVVLASRNPLTSEYQVIERSIEQLMRSAGREDINPFLMPNDAIACYDSDVSNLRDFARTLGEVITPLNVIF